MSLNIVLGVGGGIAAYKTCHLIRGLREAGHQVKVIPTENALKFVGAATFEALSGQPVATSVFHHVDQVEHVAFGQTADLIIVAPATADLIAKIAHGRADDLLTSTLLAATCPVVVVPAMHTEMWENPAVQRNVQLLRADGKTVLYPAHGRLTGADSGPGRLPEPEQIQDLALTVAQVGQFKQDLQGCRIVITAGGTREPIDPVRFLSNYSSGRQGFALAEIAAQRGASVTVIATDTVNLPTPCGAQVKRVTTAQQLHEAVLAEQPQADVIIMAAAVADYRPASVGVHKLKKGQDDLQSISLQVNPDILQDLVAKRPAKQLLVGFAAETGDDQSSALEYAKKKIANKGCDLLVCNDVSAGKVFGQSENKVMILTNDHPEQPVLDFGDADLLGIKVAAKSAGSKFVVAGAILDVVSKRR